MRKLPLAAFAAAALLATVARAEPAQNVDPRAHPNMAEAQRLVAEAWRKVGDAQVANKFQLAGHAELAKRHLEQAAAEIKLMAETADKNRKR